MESLMKELKYPDIKWLREKDWDNQFGKWEKQSSDSKAFRFQAPEGTVNVKQPSVDELGKIINKSHNKINDIHYSRLTNTLFIQIPDNTRVEDPFELIFNHASQSAHRHVVIKVGDNCAINFIERHLGQINGAKQTSFIEFNVGANTQINYHCIEQIRNEESHYIHREMNVGNDSRVNQTVVLLNEGFNISRNIIHLIGKGADVDFYAIGLTYSKDTQYVDTSLINIGEHTRANIHQHGVVFDFGHLAFNGIGKIERYAKHADAQQESSILMLSDTAKSDVNPILLIEEYEVTAGHAGRVGVVDQEQVYYLMSRGLTRVLAELMIIRGFLIPAIDRLPSLNIRSEVTELFDETLQREMLKLEYN